jgi:hypothetical protein
LSVPDETPIPFGHRPWHTLSGPDRAAADPIRLRLRRRFLSGTTLDSVMQRAPQAQPSVRPRTIILAVAALVIVVALGLSIYAYANSNQSAPKKAKSSTTSTKPASKAPLSAKQAKTVFMSCMAQKGIKYGSSSADISHPPAGVSTDAYKAAYKGCVYKLLAGAG